MHMQETLAESRVGTQRDAEHIAGCRAASALLGLLGRCLEEEVDAGLLGSLRGSLREPLAALGVDFGADFYGASDDALLKALAEEFTGLFVAPGGVSPFASVFETGCMYREPCDRAVEAYREAGWDFQHRLSGEFPDHIGTMLAFVSLLYKQEAETRERGEQEAARRWSERRARFVLEQLGPWGPGWFRRAAEAAFHPFYHHILRLAEQVLWSEIAELADRRKLRELAKLNQRDPKRLDYNADFRKASGL